MPVVRTYACDCGHQWTEFHQSSDDAYPDCPRCNTADPNWVPQPVAIKTNKSRAIDLAQDMAEKDYGLTDMKDSTREGEAAAKEKAPETADERHRRMQDAAELSRAVGAASTVPPHLQKPVQQFWGGPKGNKPGPRLDMLNIGKMGSLEARATGHDPMAMLHKGVKKGDISPVHTNIIARG